jgi:hypothetical protein
MHHFIFPSKDTYITNLNGFEDKNFGIDEILNVAADVDTIRSVVKYQSSSMSSSNYFLENLVDFQGVCDAYVNGTTVNLISSNTSTDLTVLYGTVIGYVNPTVVSHSNFNSSNFTGDFTGSVGGYVSSAVINGTTYTDEMVSLSDVSGSVTNLSGSMSGSSVTGFISGSMIGQLHNFSGSLNGISGTVQGAVNGTYSYYNPKFQTDSFSSLSRALIKFDLSGISSSLGSLTNPKFILRLNVLNQSELPFEYKIHAYPISQSWDMGDGRYAAYGSDLGTSWDYRDVNGGSVWYPLNKNTTIADYLTNESNREYSYRNGGGTWYYSIPLDATVTSSSFCSSVITGSSLMMSQSFANEASDIRLDVTPIVKAWICGCIPNEGIILMTSEELTVTATSNGNLGFYSKETNTIYSPSLDVVWDDSSFSTGSLEPITGDVPFVSIVKNVKKEYNHNSIVRINVFSRDRFPLKNFVKATQQSAHLTSKYLPKETYYCIKDTETEEVLINFDEGTKISCDSNGNYFMLDMTGLPQERYYKILIKTEIDGSVEIIDNDTYFKVIR